jgi:hypothetical protein
MDSMRIIMHKRETGYERRIEAVAGERWTI